MRAALSVSLALVFLECVQDLVTTPEHPAFVFGVSPDSTDLNIGDTLATTFTSALTADGRQVTHRLGLTVLSGQGVVRVDSAGRLIVLARGVAKLEVRPLSAALPGDTEIVDTVTVRGVVPRIGVRSLDTLRSIGDTVLLDTIAVALTRSGVTIPGVDIQWRQAPTSGAVTVLDSTVGRVRAAADGSASFEAFVDTAEALVSVPVRQRPATLSATDTVRLYWLGQSKTATADVRDARQNAVASAAASWRSLSPPSLDVTAGGVVKAVAPDTTGAEALTVRALGDTLKDTTVVLIAPARLAVLSGNDQVGTVGGLLAAPFVVELRDAAGAPVAEAGDSVIFTVTAGGGAIAGQAADTVLTDAQGRASVTLRLGTLVGTNTVTARGVGLTGPDVTFAATANPAGPDTLVVLSGNGQRDTVGQTLPDSFVVQVRDTFGNGVPGVIVDFAVTSGGGELSSVEVLSDASGRAAVLLTLGTVAGPNAVQASVPGTPGVLPRTFTATGDPSAPKRVTFAVQPSNVVAGRAISAAPRVAVQDTFDNLVSTATNLVTMAIAPGSCAVTVSGDTTVNATAGEAAFPDLTITKTGTGCRLAATSPGLVGATSDPFAVAPDEAYKLAFLVPPSTVRAGDSIAPPIQVEVQDLFDNRVTAANNDVTCSNATTPLGGGPPFSTLTVPAQNGVAVFDDVRYADAANGYRLRCTSPGLVSTPPSNPFNVTAGDPFSILKVSGDNQNGLVGQPLADSFVVEVRDTLGNVVPGDTVIFKVTAGDGSFGGPDTVIVLTGAAGRAAALLTLGPVVTTNTATARSTRIAGTTVTFTATATGVVDLRLVFIQQPTSTTGGAVISPAVQVQVQDAGGVPQDVSINVTLSIASGTGTAGATLSGTRTVTTSSGVATFSNLTVDKAGVGYRLEATASGLTSATSDLFDVAVGPPARLAFTTQPASGTAGATLATFQVAVQDAGGNVVTTATDAVTLSIASGPAGDTIIGTATVSAGSGVATFGDISFQKAGDHQLAASSGVLTSAVSNPFSIGPASPERLVFVVQPSSPATAGAAFSVQVAVRDTFGNAVTGATEIVSLSLVGGSAGANLRGVGPTAAAEGIASFQASVDSAGTSYRLVASAPGLDSATSDAFAVDPAPAVRLAFLVQPASTLPNTAIAPPVQVAIQDSLGNTVTVATELVQLSLTGGTTGAVLTGGGAVNATAGVAAFAGLSADLQGADYRLVASSPSNPNLAPATSDPFSITTDIIRLRFTAEPSPSYSADQTFGMTVEVVDGAGNRLITDTRAVTLRLQSGTGTFGATLSGITLLNASEGVVTFTGLAIDSAGTGYRLIASASGANPDTTAVAFDIIPGAPVELVFRAEPTSRPAGDAFSPPVTVAVRDAKGNDVTIATELVQLSLVGGKAGANLRGTTSAAPAGGVAFFDSAFVDSAGTGYRLVATSGALTPDTSDAFTITATDLDRVVVTPAGATVMAPGATQQFSAAGMDAFGNVIGGLTFTWASLNPFVASIQGSTGLASSSGDVTGQTTITASALGVTGHAVLTVVLSFSATPVNLWAPVASGTSAELRAVWGANDMSVLAVGESGTILRFDGSTWSPLSSGTLQHLFGVWGAAASDGFVADVFAVGANRTVLRFDGSTWSSLTSVGSDQDGLIGVWGSSPSDVYVVGAGGWVRHFDGSGWTITSGGSGGLSGIWGQSAGDIFISGLGQPAVRYDGSTFTPQASATNLKALWATSSSDLFAVGVGGLAQRFNGISWSTVATPTANTLNAVWGSSSSDVYAVGDGGVVLRFDGSAWTAMTSGTTQNLNGVWGTDAKSVFVVGGSGTILRGYRVTTVAVTPANPTLTALGATVDLLAEARDGNNNLIGGVSWTWTSSDNAVATVDTAGVVTAVANGTATITAAAPGGASGSTTVTVMQEVASVTVTPDTATITSLGATKQFAATAYDANSNPIAGVTFTWTSDDTTVAAVDQTGLVTAVGNGVATIRATAPNLVNGTATVTVTQVGFRLAFVVEPSTAPARVRFVPPVQVEVQDSLGVRVTSATTLVTLALGENPTGATLLGTVTVAADSGVATFDSVAVSLPGTGYTLVATTNPIAFDTSVAFDVTAPPPPGAPAGLVQLAANGVDTLLTGQVTAERTVVLRAAGTDTKLVTSLTLEVEVEEVGTGFDSVASATSAAFATGESGLATVGGLLDSASYHWQARVCDDVGLCSAWTSFGGNAESDADFRVFVPAASVTVTPANPTLTAIGQMVQLSAEAFDAGGNPLTRRAFTWSSDNEAVATVDSTGKVTAVGLGQANVTATTGGVSGATTVTVAQGASQLAFVVQPSSTPARVPMTPPVQVEVQDSLGVRVTSATTLVTLALGQNPTGATLLGSVTVAADSGVATFDSVAVSLPGTGYTLVATTNPIAFDTSAVFDVTAPPPPNTPADLTQLRADSVTVLATGQTATEGAVVMQATGTDPKLATNLSLEVEVRALPDAFLDVATAQGAQLAAGSALTVRVEGLASDTSYHWQARVCDDLGLCSGWLAYGGNAETDADFRVFVPAESVVVTPGADTLTTTGATVQLSAQAFDAQNNALPPRSFVWRSSDTTVARVDSLTGLVTAVGNGVATISATTDSVSGQATVTVALVAASVAVTPAADTLRSIGATRQLMAEARDSANVVISGLTNSNYTWTSRNTSVATVDASGLVTAVADGALHVVAVAPGGAADSALILVAQVVASVTVTPPADTLTALGATVQLTAEARDSLAAVVTGRPVTWTSSDTTVATVNGSGLVTAVGNGVATITATVDGVPGTSTITVAQVVATVEVTPTGATTTGATQAFTATAKDSLGSIVAGAVFSCSSLNTNVATAAPVSGGCEATAVASGQVTIRAVANGDTAYALLTVAIPGATPVNLWTEDASGTTDELNDVWGVSATSDYVAKGGFDAVLHYNGTNWTAQTGPFSMQGVWGSSDSDVFAVGLASIQHYNGSSWTQQASLSDHFFNAVWGAAPNDVFAVAGTSTGTGYIYHYDGSSWTQQTTTGSQLYGVYGFSRNEVYAVGASGAVWKYDGSTWSAFASPGGTINNIWGTSGSDLYVATSSGVYRYDGSSWNQILSASNREDVWGTSGSDAYAISSFSSNVIKRYNGSTWSDQTLPASYALEAIWGLGGGAVVAVGSSGKILRGYRGATATVTPASPTLTALGATVDLLAEARDGGNNLISGVSWTWTSSNTAVATVDTAGVVTAVANGTVSIIATTPGGAADTVPVTVAAVASVVVTPAGAAIAGGTQTFTAVALGAAGDTVPGKTFTWQSLNPNVATIDASTGVATAVSSGQVTVAATADGVTGYGLLTVAIPGAAAVNLWATMPSPTADSIRAVWGAAPSDVFAVGLRGVILHFDGASWTTMLSPLNTHLYGVWGTSGSDVFAAGDQGKIIHYDGNTWTEVANPTPNYIRGLWAASPRDVWGVGDLGTIVHFDGSAWTVVPNPAPSNQPLLGVWGTSRSDVWATNVGGTILRYDGNAWGTVSSPPGGALYGVWGTSMTDVFAVGDNGRILHYDGVWGTVASPTSNQFSGLSGTSSDEGVAVGRFGTLARLSTGAWSAVTVPTGNDIYGAWIPSNGDAFAVGDGGLILRGYRGATVTVTPANPTLTAIGATVDLLAEARDGANTLISGVSWTWTSSNTGVATVDTAGVVTAVANGTAQIVAAAPGGAADTVTVTVSQVATSVEISPAGATVDVPGGASPFTVTARDANNNAIAGAAVSWQSFNTSVATVNASTGAITALSAGQVTLGATVDALTARAVLIVTDSGAQAVNLWTTMTSGTGQDVHAVWGSSASNVFAVGLSGTILRYNGSSWSTMTSGTGQHLNAVWGVSDTAVFAVGTNGTIRRFDGTSWNTMASGTTTELSSLWGTSDRDLFAGTEFSQVRRFDGTSWSQVDVGTPVRGIWGSSSSDVFAVGGYDLEHVVHYDGSNWSAPVFAGRALYTVWGIAPLDVYAGGGFGTLRRYTGGSWVAMTAETSTDVHGLWGASGADIYAVGYPGSIRRYDGSSWGANIAGVTGATLNGVWGTSTEVIAVGDGGTIVRGVRGATVAVTPANPTLTALGATVDLLAEARDGGNNVISGVSWTWTSSNTGVATVDTAGVVTAVANGTVSIVATAPGGAADTVPVTVAAVASVVLTPAGAAIGGGTQAFTAVALGAAGDTVPGKTFTWQSLNSNVATIDVSTGVATAVSSGQVTVSATADGVTGYGLLTVAIAAATPVNLWAAENSGTASSLNGVWGASASDLFATGDGGLILRNTGGGWAPMTNVVVTLGPIWGSSGTDIWVGTGAGSMYRYNGSTWSLTQNTSLDVRHIWGSAPNNVYAVGSGTDRVFRYNGTTWAAVSGTGISQDARAVWGTSASDVWVVGRSGSIAHYDGSGWTTTTVGTVDLTGVWGTAANNVHAVGGDPATTGTGTVLHWNGTSWSSIVTGAADSYRRITGTNGSEMHLTGRRSTGDGAVFDFNGATVTVALTISGANLAAQEIWATPTDVVAVGSPGRIARGYRGATVTVTPASPTLTSIGATVDLLAEARDGSNNLIGGVSWTWTSNNTAVATVDTAGVVTAVANGEATITATAPGGAASLNPVFVSQQVASVGVSPASDTLLALAAASQFGAQAFDSGGSPIAGVTFAWSTSNSGVATVDASGLVTAAGNGGAYVIATAGGVSDSAIIMVSGSVEWREIANIITPTGRNRHAAVYNNATERLVVFGGQGSLSKLNDVWVLPYGEGCKIDSSCFFSGGPSWTQLSPTGGPPAARNRPTAVYDQANNRIILFGGLTDAGTTNDVWVLTGADGTGATPSWQQLSPSGGPPQARWYHSAVYDAANNRMTVLPGEESDGTCSSAGNSVWVLTNANGLGGTPTWTQLSPTGTPPSGGCYESHSAVYDSVNNRVILFGGSKPTTTNEAWVLTNANGLGGTPQWVQLSPSGTPPTARVFHTAVYDAASNRMIVFGGANYTLTPAQMNDVWVLSNANGLSGTPQWTQLSPSGSAPAARELHAAAYVPGINLMIATMGGAPPTSNENDTWVLFGANGAPAGVPAPPVRLTSGVPTVGAQRERPR